MPMRTKAPNVTTDCIRLISLECEADILGKIFLVVSRTG
jgi:hypothetical protein